MSGTNPFRRRTTVEPGSSDFRQAQDERLQNQLQAQPPVLDTGEWASLTRGFDNIKPAKKTVRIISPHSSPESGRRIHQGLFSLHHGSTESLQTSSEPVNGSGSSSPVDPFDIESSDDGGITTSDEGFRRNALTNASSLDSTSSIRAAESADVFRSSIVGREGAVRPAARSERGLFDRVGSSTASDKPAVEEIYKPHYTVDEFKTLLLTGKKAPIETLAPVHTELSRSVQLPVKSSNSTDASPTFHRSILELSSASQLDTHSTSHEIYGSEDGSLSPMDTPGSTNVGGRSATKYTHDSYVDANLPRMVPFEDPHHTWSAHGAVTGNSSPNSSRILTDLNKPLPPPPASIESHSEDSAMSYPSQPHRQERNSPSRARQPPAPPLSRRHSQARPKSLLNTPIKATGSLGASPSDVCLPSPVPTSKSPYTLGPKVPPPPPPPRRPGPVRGLSESSSASALSTVATPTSSSFTDDSAGNVSKQRPPVPPTRNRSNSSAKRAVPVTSRSGGPNVAPTPPRRRGSSQSSLNPLRDNPDDQQMEIERQSGSATSSLQSKDIINDLSTLQREVDALRGKFKD